ncbi:8425_t:CDS:2 [Racocetra fulgida]|uniref:8425_t:CDS:1 n=1 Tax=Racocetra fulgida TaxID=60492 RepID=A0A9N8VJX1_9GLOM|nr:8425_t:CDS:2 [Racocetra fulgida]
MSIAFPYGYTYSSINVINVNNGCYIAKSLYSSNIESTLVRLNESRWTQLFMLIAILQVITIIILELRVYSRNVDIERSLNSVGNITVELDLNATCIFQPSYIQWVEVKKWYLDFEEDCPNRLPLHTQFLKYDAPVIVALLLFSIIVGFICFKLYQQFGWNIYKKIGADLSMQDESFLDESQRKRISIED